MPTARDADGWLTLGGLRLSDVILDPRVGTPAYVYDLDGVSAGARALHVAFDGARHLVAYAVKANGAGPIVRALAAEGCGADVVSGGELQVALGCGVPPDAIVFSGVAKGDDEIDRAIAAGDRGIHALQLESLEELSRVEARARSSSRRARVAIRVNPGVDKSALDTHDHIATGHDEAKFGVARSELDAAVSRAVASQHVELVGVSTHVGSQLTTTEGYVAAARVVLGVARAARERGAPLGFVGTGGGFGIDYGQGCTVAPGDFVRAVRAEQRGAGLEDLALHVEPGRSLVGAHGVLVARVIQGKRAEATGWVFLDAGMNDLIRPALYQAKHRIVPLRAEPEGRRMRVAGPVCESSDDFGEHDGLVEAGGVALLDAGAYGFTMASEYNGRPLPAEVFLRGGRIVGVASRRPASAWAAERIAIEG